MDGSEIETVVRRHVAERNLFLWESFPWNGAVALWPEDDDQLDAFLKMSELLGARILYMDKSGDIVGFPEAGVIHAFPSSNARGRLGVSDPLFDSPEDDEDGETRLSDYDSPYYDYRTERTLAGQLREVVDSIVADERFDGYQSRWLVAEYTANLSAQDAESVDQVARRLFDRTKGKELDKRVQQLVPGLAADADFDPLSWGDDLTPFLTARLDGEDPRVIQRLGRALPDYAREQGLAAEVKREIVAVARGILDGLPILTRDEFGFASKNATRLQLITPELNIVSDSRKDYVLREMVNLELEHYATAREARYATAIRRLLDRRNTKSEISRRLGLSTSVMDRLLRTHRIDVEFLANDPILTTLVPELG